MVSKQNEICRAFGGAQHDVTVERLSPSKGNPISVPDMKHRSGGINARHYLMVRDREPWAKQYNQAVVSTIHDMIGVLRSDSESYTWKSPETFGDQIGSVLKTFVSNCSGVTVPQIGEGLYGIVPKKIDHAKPLGNGHETIAMVGHSEMNSFSVKVRSVRYLAQGIFTLGGSHCAICTFSKARYSDTPGGIDVC